MLRLSLFSATNTTTACATLAATAQQLTSLRHASKSSGTNTKYQARSKGNQDIGFRVLLGQPTLKGSTIVKQRSRYTNKWNEREPLYKPGRNVSMDPKVYTLTADVAGVPTLRKSKINPQAYEWIDVEPDIQKVYRSREIRRALASRGGNSQMSLKHNADYAEEEHDLVEPDWRQRVTRKIPLTERFPDPNLLTRGLVKSIEPKNKFFYE